MRPKTCRRYSTPHCPTWSHLSARVFGAGDLLQSVYLWRHAEPTLFETATDDGEYLGIDWDIHEHRTAKTTYRCVPDVASAINEISEAALTDPARGEPRRTGRPIPWARS